MTETLTMAQAVKRLAPKPRGAKPDPIWDARIGSMKPMQQMILGCYAHWHRAYFVARRLGVRISRRALPDGKFLITRMP